MLCRGHVLMRILNGRNPLVYAQVSTVELQTGTENHAGTIPVFHRHTVCFFVAVVFSADIGLL